MKVLQEEPTKNDYQIVDGQLYVNGQAFDFQAVVDAAKKLISDDISRISDKRIQHELHKKVLYSSMHRKDSNCAPSITSIERLKDAFITLNEDLYLQAQLGLTALSFAENVEMLGQMGYRSLIYRKERIETGMTLERLSLIEECGLTGLPQRVNGEAKVLPNYPSMTNLKKALSVVPSKLNLGLSNFEKSDAKGVIEIQISTTEKVASLVQKFEFLSMGKNHTLDLVHEIDYSELMELANSALRKELARTYEAASHPPDVYTHSSVARKINHKAFSGPV